MSHAGYPTSDDLQRKLVAVGLLPNPTSGNPTADFLDFDSSIGSAIEQWQDMTGYVPFLADVAETTHYFDGDGSFTVDLQGGFITISAVTVNGIGVSLNTQYRTMPRNAVLKSRPITYLMFDRSWGFRRPFGAFPGQKSAVAVTGIRGAYTTISNTAWNAILALALIQLVPDLEQSFADGALKSWKSGTTEEEYAKNPFQSMVAGWQGVIDRALLAGTGNKRPRIA